MKVHKPKIGKKVFIDPSAQVIGKVTVGDYSSIWPGCVIRGDIQKIVIGHHSNVQDLTVIHVESDQMCRIGNFVTVGHGVILHACTVKDRALIGMGSIVLDRAVIEENVILGAGSLVTQGDHLKSGGLYFGRPAKFVRKLAVSEIRELRAHALRYVKYAQAFQTGYFARFHTRKDVL